jgi:histidinol-phosphate phosphatase family protein
VAFLDDDVVVRPDWRQQLASDLIPLPPDVAGSQGRLEVPLARHRRATDWERNVAGLAHACWATADMAYRRDVLEEVAGFDERFPRAFREDADLGLRITEAGYLIVRGERTVDHPVRPAGGAVSIRMQRGNADDVLMRLKHGPDWRLRALAEPGRTARHLLTTGAGAAAVGGLLAGRRSIAATGLAGWLAGTGELVWARVGPGPRTRREVATMLVTSAVIPAAATYHCGRGWLRMGGLALQPDRPAGRSGASLRFRRPAIRARVQFGSVPRQVSSDVGWHPRAVLFDRDGTLIVDSGYPRDPQLVSLMPGARMAIRRVRQAGLAAAVVTNQSAVGRGLMTLREVESVNARIEEMVGPLDTWAICWHAPEDGCACRKPAPGLVVEAAARLGVRPAECVVIGDIGADVRAAEAAGARSILVPTRRTRAREVRAARQVAPNLLSAVDLVLGGRC